MARSKLNIGLVGPSETMTLSNKPPPPSTIYPELGRNGRLVCKNRQIEYNL